MFMGDTGSQFLGLFLATMGIDNCWNIAIPGQSLPLVNFVLVLLVFIIPLTDTTTVVINRLRAGSSPFIGGKDHTTHHLFFKGITEKRIAILFFFLNIVGVSFAYNLIFNFSYTLLYVSIFYILLVFVTLYLNTIIKRS
jgi:UDP-GlcNAc:undecaprenyl-phosphate/decaprenyl-phosphate GlcNAc-1-phosphate transferase